MRSVLLTAALKVTAVLTVAGALLPPLGAAAQELERATPLEITVRPSGFEAGPAGETLDQKLARRDRSFRFICIGCARVDGRVVDAPFRPIETLNAPQLTAALAVRAERVEAAPE